MNEMKGLKKTTIKVLIMAAALVITNGCLAEDICKGDNECLHFEALSDRAKNAEIVSQIEEGKKYSEGTQFYIALALSVMAGQEQNIEKSTLLFLKSIKYGGVEAYMDLFRLYFEVDREKAYSYLYQYEKLRPKDSDLYFSLGENEFEKGDVKKSHEFLTKSKKYSTGHSAGLDWLLFKTSYLLGDYAYSFKMFESFMAQARLTNDEINELKKDGRFADISDRKEFKQFEKLFVKLKAKTK